MDTDIQALFEESLLRFNRERYTPSQWSEYGRFAEAYSPAIWTEMEGLGWFELLRADEDREAPVAELLALFKAAGEALWREPISAIFGESAAIAATVGDSERRSQLLAGLVSGTHPLGFAHRESHNAWSPEGLTTTARKCAGDCYEVSGDKVLVAAAPACSGYIVSALAADDGHQPRLYLVDAQAPGLTIKRYRTIDDRWAADLQLLQAPAELLCPAVVSLHKALARGAILAAAEAVGIMRGANHDTIEYLRQRRQFGKSLLSFQALQHRLVEMQMRQHESEALVANAADAFDIQAPGLDRLLLVLRVQVSRALRHITREAVQMHGGMGVTRELRIGRYYQRALMLDSLYGTADWALDGLSRN